MLKHRDYYVYMWRNKVTDKMYIGKGRGNRVLHHRRMDRNTPFHKALRSYGLENFEYRILASEMEESRAHWLEREMVRQLATKMPFGYNLTDGGEGISGVVQSKETIEKRMVKIRPILATTEYRQRASRQASKQWQDPVMRAKMSVQTEARRRKNAARRLPPNPEAFTLVASGVSPIQTAKKLGVSHTTVYGWLYNAGWTKIGTTRPVWVPPEAAKSEES